MPADPKSKFLGGMIGSAIGDAIGELAFVYPREDILCSEVTRVTELQYTDDTAMAIGLAESLSKVCCIDHQHLGKTFSKNFHSEPWRGYGSGPPTVFSLVERKGLTYLEAARSLFGGEGSLGNGAAMRIVPLGLFFYHSKELYEQARASAQITHTHPVGIDGAAVQAFAVAQVVKLDPKNEFPWEQFIQSLIGFARMPQLREKMNLVKLLIAQDVPPDAAALQLGRTVAVHESMPFAIYSFLRNAKSFEKCLFCATLHAGDRDTLGAMACAISGAYLGVEAIPETWRQKLENRAYIERVASTLAEMSGTSSLTPSTKLSL